MCYIDLEPCEVWREAERRARKAHRCSCCRREIQPGETYLVHFSIFDGNSCSEKLCSECERDRKEFGNAHGGTLCSPGYFPMMLMDCIAEDGDEERWGPMLSRIRAHHPSDSAASAK